MHDNPHASGHSWPLLVLEGIWRRQLPFGSLEAVGGVPRLAAMGKQCLAFDDFWPKRQT